MGQTISFGNLECKHIFVFPLPSTSSLDVATKKAFENDSKAKNALMCGLKVNELVKVINCKTAKEI